jgi:hypothetical protein
MNSGPRAASPPDPLRTRHLHQLLIPEIYADEGISGTVPVAERPEGARLLGERLVKVRLDASPARMVARVSL